MEIVNEQEDRRCPKIVWQKTLEIWWKGIAVWPCVTPVNFPLEAVNVEFLYRDKLWRKWSLWDTRFMETHKFQGSLVPPKNADGKIDSEET